MLLTLSTLLLKLIETDEDFILLHPFLNFNAYLNIYYFICFLILGFSQIFRIIAQNEFRLRSLIRRARSIFYSQQTNYQKCRL